MKKKSFASGGTAVAIWDTARNLMEERKKPGAHLPFRCACLLVIVILALISLAAPGQAATIAAGGEHSLGLKPDGTVVAWGFNNEGQCNVPAGLNGVVSVAVAACLHHNLALKADGTVVTWGWNYRGQCDVPAGLRLKVPPNPDSKSLPAILPLLLNH